jgi:hypothetical protein
LKDDKSDATINPTEEKPTTSQQSSNQSPEESGDQSPEESSDKSQTDTLDDSSDQDIKTEL